MNGNPARIVAALDQLILAESLALRAWNIAAAVTAQGRAAPLIRVLGQAHAAGSIPEALRPQLREIAERRRQNQHRLAEMKAQRWTELERLRADRRRLVRTMPAYAPRKPKATFIVRG